MRRTIFLALLAALSFAPAARAADPTKIIRDCADDGTLQGTYTSSELREARSQLPTDIDEYSDCRDVLSRALASKASSSNDSGGPDTSQGGGATGAGGGGADTGTSSPTVPSVAGDPGPSVAVDPGIETGPVSAQDWEALRAADKAGDRGVSVNGRDVSPLLAADVGRNGLPATLIVALALVGVAVLTALLLPLRRRVLRRQA